MPGDTFDLRKVEFVPYSSALLPRIQRAGFDCGNAELNEFLNDDVDAHSREHIAQTTLLLVEGSLAGYFSLCAGVVRLGDEEAESFLARGFPYRSMPALKIARLGVDRRFKRRRLGLLAVTVVVGIAARMQRDVGCRFLTVDAKREPEAICFWEHVGFERNEARSSLNDTISYRLDLLNPPPHGSPQSD